MASAATISERGWRGGPHFVRLDRAAPMDRDRFLTALAWSVIGVGLAWRLIRYALSFPIWGDEAMLALNLAERGWHDLFEPLERGQVAPALFVLGEWCCYQLLGGSEYSLRLLPLLASLLSVPLFWTLARTTLPPRPALLATALLSISIWPVSMGSLVKPYSGDLFWSLMLLIPAAQLLQDPTRGRWWLMLLLGAPLAIFASFPAIFIAGAVGLALVPIIWRRRSRGAVVGLVAYGLVVLTAFASSYLSIIQRTHGATRDYMDAYWSHGFAPAQPVAFLAWLVKAHAGQMLAYPIGAAAGGSVVTLALVVAGAVVLWRRPERGLLVLCLTPFALGISASFMRSYPYGESCRLAQHLAPPICLMAALGLDALLARRWFAARAWPTVALLSLWFAIGLAGIARDALRPFRGEGDLWARKVARELARHVRAGDRLLVSLPTGEMDACFQWHLLHEVGSPILLQGGCCPDLVDCQGNVWCLDLHFGFDARWRPGDPSRLSAQVDEALCDARRAWRRQPVQRFVHVQVDGKRQLVEYCGVHCWTRDAQAPLLASWAP